MLLDKTYTEFKEDVYERLGDLKQLEGKDFNALKIVLDGLKVQYSKRGRIDVHIFDSPLRRTFRRWVYSILRKGSAEQTLQQLLKARNKKILLISSPNRTDSGELHSIYFQRVLESFPDPSAAFFMNDRASEKGRATQADLFPLYRFLEHTAPDAEEKELLSDIHRIVQSLESGGKFNATEMHDIKVAFKNFFSQFRVWKFALQHVGPKVCFFRCHYHKEGALLALRRKGVYLVELQHGLIAPEDIFYIFPPSVKAIREKCLFGDELLVYGQYWKKLVESGAEYAPEKIKSIGYYNEIRNDAGTVQRTRFLDDVKGRNILLLTCQTGSDAYFIAYAQHLDRELEKMGDGNYVVVVKPHVNEPFQLYADALQGLKHVLLYQDNIDFVLSHSSLLVTIYSTTVFDAMRYGLPSFSLEVPEYMDYVNTFVEKGFSRRLPLNGNPLLLLKSSPEISPAQYYTPFKPDVIRNCVTAHT